MKNIVRSKHSRLSIMFLFGAMALLVLFGCFNPMESPKGAMLTINLGGKTKAAYPHEGDALNAIVFELELTGPTGTINHTLSNGKLSASFTVAAGL